MRLSLDGLAAAVLEKAAGRQRFLVAIAGPPGSGKSTTAKRLGEALALLGETAAVLPMDGFHMDNGVLEARGLLARKGAPETFDVRGFADILRAVRVAAEEVLVPVFDRSRELAIAGARPIGVRDRFILVEGNYLLLDSKPWDALSDLFDLTIFLAPAFLELERRLRDRWAFYGLDGAAIAQKLDGNDLPNCRLVLSRSRPADMTLDEVDWPDGVGPGRH